jgi:hypothetical protein
MRWWGRLVNWDMEGPTALRQRTSGKGRPRNELPQAAVVYSFVLSADIGSSDKASCCSVVGF